MTSRRQFLRTSSAAAGFALGGHRAQTESAIGQPDSDDLLPTKQIVQSMSSKLSEIVSVTDFGAVGDGLANDTAALQAAATAAGGGVLYFPKGTYLVTAQINILANTLVQGTGSGSIIKTATASTHLFACTSVTRVVIRNLTFVGVKGTTVLNNSAVFFNRCSYCRIEECEASGMSGMAICCSGSDHIDIENNYIHGLTADATMQNSCDIGLYQNNDSCTVRNNRCLGGGVTWIGIAMLQSATNHIIDGNHVGPHYAYGILDYDTVHKTSNNTVTKNSITTIDGGALAGASGAGIYVAGVGGGIYAYNRIDNTNISTRLQRLAPGAIGIDNPFSSVLVFGNAISAARWYGIYVTPPLDNPVNTVVTIQSNRVLESLKPGIYLVNVSNAIVDNNTVVQFTGTPRATRCIGVNVQGGSVGPFTNVKVSNNQTIGGSVGIDIAYTNNLVVTGNDLSQSSTVTGALVVRLGAGAVIANNIVDATSFATAPAFVLDRVTSASVSGNTFSSKANGCVVTSGTCTGSLLADSNLLVGKTVNNIVNGATGCIVSSVASSASRNTAAVGDHIRNSVPAVGQPKGWFCTVAGNPGTWIAEGNL